MTNIVTFGSQNLMSHAPTTPLIHIIQIKIIMSYFLFNVSRSPKPPIFPIMNKLYITLHSEFTYIENVVCMLRKYVIK